MLLSVLISSVGFLMPIIWRYLLGQYLKVFGLCVTAFIAVLLTTRIDEIAHFATLGPEGIYIFLFALYQIPYILPIAIPFSCLISALLLIQRLSVTHELTSLRASGLSIWEILTPIMIGASLISTANFYIISELATNSHLETSILKSELRAVNPLLILHNKHLIRMKGIYFDTMGASKVGESASDIVLAMPDKHNHRLNVMFAHHLHADPLLFSGKDVTLITGLQTDESEKFDHLMLENIKNVQTSIKDFSQILQKKVWTLNNDHLRFGLLRVRINENRQLLAEAPSVDVHQLQRSINRSYSELIRRVSVSLAAFTFSLMGAAFGMSIGRHRSNRSLFCIIFLAVLYMIAYFAAKAIDYQLLISSLIYLLPHLLIIGLSILVIKRLSKGIEGVL